MNLWTRPYDRRYDAGFSQPFEGLTIVELIGAAGALSAGFGEADAAGVEAGAASSSFDGGEYLRMTEGSSVGAAGIASSNVPE